ncbi:MAG: imidazolonepropionase [Legionellaceae bacterium]|nr:imidazolonepropionase [Legionellaceae bacterium]
MNNDLVIQNATIATFAGENKVLRNASIAIKDGRISEISDSQSQLLATNVIDAKEKLVTPGLIDCHTHIVHAGNRSDEFEMRLNGATYAQIAEHGGGILSTVNATRKASIMELTTLAKQRAKTMLQHGCTTIEIKSGYGLDLETEIKMLTVARSLENLLPISVVTTYLGAHTTPPEYKNQKDEYIDYIISSVLPVIAKKELATFVDGFCETIAFNFEQIERLFQAATKLGFAIKLHTEQLTNQQGASLAAKYNASSVDHLEYLANEDCINLANDKTVAVLLPGAFYFLKEKQRPPVSELRANKIPIAIATDANPGSSPFYSLPLMMNMACISFELSIDEAWLAVTKNAAKALNLEDEIGSLERDKKADLVLWSTDNLNDIVYNPTINYCEKIIKSGVVVI